MRPPSAGWVARVGAVVLVSLWVGSSAWQGLEWSPPSADEVRAAHRSSDARLLARDGRLLHEVRIDRNRRVLGWTPLERVSPALVAAVRRSEDQRFREHRGVDPWALAAAGWQWLTEGVRRGASTISMQLVALLDADLRATAGRRTWSEKLRQMRAALDLEDAWSKDEILEAYLNLVPLRGEVEGVTAAAGVLLGKEPHGIDAAEAAVLAALLRAPSARRAAVRQRARDLLGGAPGPSRATLDTALDRIFAVPNRRGPTPRMAPHLAQRLLAASPDSRTVHSTIDADLQRHATRALAHELASVRRHNVRDGAVLVLDNDSGDVLAYVGGSGALSNTPHVDGVRARRQAGSTLKPFLYALALDRRILTAASLLDDSPLEVPLGGSVYRPRNYDESFRGRVSLRTALASSLNVPAVRTQRLLGEPAFVDRLTALEFGGLVTTGDHYGPSLTLGSAEVSLLELANAYRTLMRGGVHTPVRFTSNQAPEGSRRVYSRATSFVVADVLSDREARAATFGLENALATRFWTAVKTGTSKEMRDNWCVGFSGDYTVAVWVGNDSGEPMHEVSGITGAAPTWLSVMSYLHRDRPGRAPAAPEGVTSRRVSFPDGAGRIEWFLDGTEPAQTHVRKAHPPAHIASPAEGALLALDPDIPAGRQQLALVASPAGSNLVWQLDGKALGPADQPVLWPPRAGRHQLRLLDDTGAEVDRVRFLVR